MVVKNLELSIFLLTFLQDISADNIETEIANISSIYEEILYLNGVIKETDFIKLEDFTQIKEESIKKNRQTELQKYHTELLHDMEKFSNGRDPEYIKLSNKLQDVRNELQQLSKYFMQPHIGTGLGSTTFFSLIQRLPAKFLDKNLKLEIDIDTFIRQNKDLEIISLEIIKLNYEKRNRLKEIYDEYHSQDYVKELLSKLYQKQLEIIKPQEEACTKPKDVVESKDVLESKDILEIKNIPGIDESMIRNFTGKGVLKTIQLIGQFMVFQESRELFERWLEYEIGIQHYKVTLITNSVIEIKNKILNTQ